MLSGLKLQPRRFGRLFKGGIVQPQRGSADGKRRCGLKFKKIASVHMVS